MKILIVEDDEPTRSTLKEVLSDYCKDKNNICLDADSIEQTKKILDVYCPDIIFLDILLKGDYGMPLIAYAREKYKDHPPKIVVMSALMNIHKVVGSYNPDAIVSKPFDLDVLMNFLK